MSKIAPFRIRKKDYALTPLMIASLLEACLKQKQNIPFGPADIKGSFNSLINRDLIIRETINITGKNEAVWQVSSEGIKILKNLGVELPDNF
jgi:hypothetical protein